jgi:hypothetical protein
LIKACIINDQNKGKKKTGSNLNDSHEDCKIHNTILKHENNAYQLFTLWIGMFLKNCFKHCCYIELIWRFDNSKEIVTEMVMWNEHIHTQQQGKTHTHTHMYIYKHTHTYTWYIYRHVLCYNIQQLQYKLNIVFFLLYWSSHYKLYFFYHGYTPKKNTNQGNRKSKEKRKVSGSPQSHATVTRFWGCSISLFTRKQVD